MSKPKKIFCALFSLSILLGIYVLSIYKHQTETNMTANMDMLKIRVERALESVFFDVNLLEALVVFGYEDVNQEAVEILLKPIYDQPVVRNLTFAPDGIINYIHPFKGNEKEIGANIYTIQERKIEAQLAIETKEIILCGPYELTQGGVGFVARKAVFIPNELGKDELWGFVSIVLDISHIVANIDFAPLKLYGYEYELSADVNGLGKKIIVASDNFDAEDAIYVDINLSNGKWQLGLNKVFNAFEVSFLILLFLSGILASIMIYQILEKKDKQLAALEEKMYIDPLTGIYNRKKLDFIEEQSIYLQQAYAVFYLDLNDFKQINDTYGHEVGDNILIAFTQRAKKIIKENDLLIRVGGDEFIVILFNIAHEVDVKNFADRLRTHISQKLILNKIEFVMTASIGYARYPVEEATLDKLVSLADSRMYEDKKNKKKQSK